MLIHVTEITHVIAATAFFGMCILLAASQAQHRYKHLLLAAAGSTALWSVAAALSGIMPTTPALVPVTVILEQVRSLGWMAVVAFVLFIAYPKRVDRALQTSVVAAVLVAAGYVAAVSMYAVVGEGVSQAVLRSTFVARVGLAVVGLLLVENMLRNSGQEARWAVKYLCFGAGIIFAYDFFVYADASLVDRVDARFYAARGIVVAMAAPLIVLAAARSKSWPIDIHVSRQFVFHSATLLAGGVYLIVMSIVGYSLRALDGTWGTVAQATFLTAALLVLAIVLTSGKIQAALKGYISRNFFSYKYDYRKEWVGFIESISTSLGDLTVPDRALRALANLVDSTSAALWSYREEEKAFHCVSAWNMGDQMPVIAHDDPFPLRLAVHRSVVAIATGYADGVPTTNLAIPRRLAVHQRACLVLPLFHVDRLIGFAVLGPMRAARTLTNEDFDLLKTAGKQVASYLAESEAALSLTRARKFEDFNRHFAFVVHDIKNLTGQMTLLLQNAERHGSNPEFQRDMLHTIGHAVRRMRTMLEQLRSGAVTGSRTNIPFDVTRALRLTTDAWKLQIPALTVDLPDEPVHAIGDAERFDVVVNHLVQNANDAVSNKGAVSLEMHIEGKHHTGGIDEGADESWVVVTVSDSGPGMDRNFIEQKLFEPMQSEKSGGFGIGAFQTRQLIREMGGKLDVESRVGAGTHMIIRLPLSRKLAAVKPQAFTARKSELRASFG